MTPLSLHATAAAWSLNRSRDRLTYLAEAERRQAGEALTAAGPLQSPRYGVRMPVGSHGDPVSATLVADRPSARDRTPTEMLQELERRISGIARMFRADRPDLAAIRAIIPGLRPANARMLTIHLRDEDKWVRAACRLDPARRPLPGVLCPACRARNLYVQDAGPSEVWTVVCDGRWEDGQHNPCLCVGPACPCGVEGAVEGVAHIWRLGAVAGATPTHTTT